MRRTYGIEETPGALKLVSPNAAAKFARGATGRQVNASNLVSMEDAERAAIGVYRLVGRAPSTSRFQEATLTGAVKNGNVGTSTWAITDASIEAAQAAVLGELRGRATGVRGQGVVVDVAGVNYVFGSGGDDLEDYQSLGSAMGAGVPYPADPVPFRARRASNGRIRRVDLDVVAFRALVSAVAMLRLDTARREARLETLIGNTTDLAGLIVEEAKIPNGWPNEPPFPPIGA